MTYSYYFFLGTINLIILSWQDFKNNMKIDDRKNAIMIGVAISLLSHKRASIWYLLILAAITTFMFFWLRKFKAIGEGDINALVWIYLGVGIISAFLLLWFVIYFTIVVSLYTLLKRAVFKYKGNLPFMPILLITFILFSGVLGLYGS